MVPLPTEQQPALDSFVQFIGWVKTPALLPGSPDKVIASNVFHCKNKVELINRVNEQMQGFMAQQGMLVAKPDNPKIMNLEHMISVEFKLFVPMYNIRFIETVVSPMTELPRVEEPGIPLLGQGVETKELKPS
jgi:hypothetical protein